MTEVKAKNPNSSARLVIVLFLISAIVALCLGLVNYITADRIEAIKAEKTAAAMAEVMPGGYEFQAVTAEWADPVVSAYAALSGADTQGYVVEVVIAGSQGDIDMLVGVDLEGCVTGVAIVDMQETAGLGDKAADADWRSQFVGASGQVAVTKDGGTIDAITGATVTSRAVANGVNAALTAAGSLLG